MKNGCIGLVAAIFAYSTSLVLGASLPYSNSFEAYPDGYAITNDADWTSAGAITSITNVNYLGTAALNTAYMGAPLSDTHDKVLSFENAPLTNNYSSSSVESTVAIDTMIRPNISDELKYDSAVSNSHFSIAFLTNGVAVWHGVQTAPRVVDYQQWSILNASSTPVSTGKWCRLTITLNYQGAPDDGFGVYNPMFQVKIDGQALTSPYGHEIADFTSPTNGSWLSMAPSTLPTFISALVLNGSGMIDDLNVQPSAPVDYVTSTYGIPYNWFIVTGVTNDTSSNAMAAAESGTADADSDGMPNWAEYLAGTEPTNSDSRLVIVSQTISNGVPTLQWLGSANALADYTIAASTNLTDPSGWSNIAVSAKTDGTNTLVLSGAPAGSLGFFRVTVVK
jgi:hypothetical protein